MSLDASTLSDGIVALTGDGNWPATYADAGERWANLYADYARAAMSPTGGSPAAVDAAIPALSSALAATFAAMADPGTTASQMADAFTLFWFAPPMAFAGAFPGVVTVVPGTAALAAALAATWASNIAGGLSARDAADAIAADLHAFTTTVVCTDATVPTPTVGPIA